MEIPEIPNALQTEFIGRTIEGYDVVTSTNDIALQRGAQGASEGTLILAEAQQAGRGRHGRGWFAPHGSSILGSLVLRHRLLQSQTGLPNLIGAVAVAEAIREIADVSAQVKWPNDVVIDDKKVCGVLTEMAYDARAHPFFVTGIGVNVNIPPEAFPDEFSATATSLQIVCGQPISRLQLLQAMLLRFETYYQKLRQGDTKPIIDAAHSLSATLGRLVVVETYNEQFEGRAESIEGDGALVLQDTHGTRRKFIVGDVIRTGHRKETPIYDRF